MPFENWDVTRRELARALLRLHSGEFLILGEPVVAQPHHGGPVLRTAPTRYVQVLRTDEVLTAECVGPASLGGFWEMDRSTIEQLCRMGWQTPAESVARDGLQSPNFDLYVELVSLLDLADLLITSLQVLDALPHELELQAPAA